MVASGGRETVKPFHCWITFNAWVGLAWKTVTLLGDGEETNEQVVYEAILQAPKYLSYECNNNIQE
jgi:hypothetical protein